MIFRPLIRDVARESANGNLNYLSLIRTKPGVAPQRVAAELNALLSDFVREFQLRGKIILTPLNQQIVRRERASLIFLLGAVAAVLLIVCVNIANLMLVRTAGRYREAGIRLALGANRFRLFNLVLTEAALLVIAGGAAGMGIAHIGLKLFIQRRLPFHASKKLPSTGGCFSLRPSPWRSVRSYVV